MISFPQIDPVLLHIGPLAIRWYGLMYTLTFVLGWFLLRIQVKRQSLGISSDALADLVMNTVLGVILGGRLGYILFYQFDYYLSNPMAMLRVWEGGMSFHGGLLGVLIAGYLFARQHQLSFLVLGDLLAVVTPVGLFLGRIGNFINGELWGRTTTLPWGVVFPGGGAEPRHPSQLYEAGLEGFFLFVLLWWLGGKPREPGFLGGVFLSGYAICRLLVEMVREPDAHLGFLALGLTMGQWLTIPMLLIGIGLLYQAHKMRK
ncbi:MAG: prolipoprotein diacylglyceryl transferase [Magnetococcales bacterium]|nr:prolipoprotein diacylglyceryl transferase [Magnetococcales bacterium]MBF0438867.1 prolipoprotein diacylglyceryl transferase [Magnetococcales bacterium]